MNTELAYSVPRRRATKSRTSASRAVVEPTEFFCLNYSSQTPIVAISAHLAYGIALVVLLTAH
jgi:hypothetical protein